MITTLPYEHTLCGEGISIVATLEDSAGAVDGDPLGYDENTRVFTADTDDSSTWSGTNKYALVAEL